jgi:hypothetical protein
MVAFKMMMFDVLAQGSSQRSFSEQNEFGQAFLPDGAHPALRESVQVQAPRRQGQWLYAA